MPARRSPTARTPIARARGRRTPPKGPRRPASRWWFLLRHLVLWCTLALAAYWLWLDKEVVTAFENRRWDLPARVFARPLELYRGAAFGPERLVAELDLLGYTAVASISGSGQYRSGPAMVEFASRGFAFWDLPETPRQVTVRFAGGRVAELSAADAAQAVDLMRLEPLEIGRINPQRFEDRELVELDEVPARFAAALVAVEDRRFYEHYGVDPLGLLRAAWINLRAGRFVQGGSTMTQQLIKNLYLTRKRTLWRKFNELLMSLSLERRYSKQEILETYINEVFLGQDGDRAIHGFELAARFYFAKPLRELDDAESALLIGLVKGPSAYNPRRHPDRARQRRDVVLGLMVEAGLLDAGAATRVRAQPLKLRANGQPGRREFPAFMAVVRRQLLKEYDAADLDAAGLNIYTTLEVTTQRAAEAAVGSVIPRLEQRGGQRELQAALVIAAPGSGELLALVSDRNPHYAGFNRAVAARRPIGSLVKPFVYAAALDQPQRYSLLSRIDDAAIHWTDSTGKVWHPRNYDGRTYGEVTLLHALTRSLNLATVRLGLELGLDQVAHYLERLGVGANLPAYPSLLLGAVERTPFELAELYTIIANDGFRVPLRAITAVTDHRQRKLNRYGFELEPVMQPATAALVRYALTRVVAEGTARALRTALPSVQPLAGKTGTSNDSRDSWFAGFGDNLLGVAWVGRDDNQPVGLTGSSGALRVWSAAMHGAGIAPLDLRLPAVLEWQTVDPATGMVTGVGCGSGVQVPLHRASPRARAADCVTPVPLTPGLGQEQERLWPR